MTEMRRETDSLGVVDVPADKLWGAQTQRSLEHFSIGKDLIPREMITAYAVLKKAAAAANHASKRLGDQQYELIYERPRRLMTRKKQFERTAVTINPLELFFEAHLLNQLVQKDLPWPELQRGVYQKTWCDPGPSPETVPGKGK